MDERDAFLEGTAISSSGLKIANRVIESSQGDSLNLLREPPSVTPTRIGPLGDGRSDCGDVEPGISSRRDKGDDQ